jgi:hypothetical protein
MPKVFISHSSADVAAAQYFRGIIEALGYEVWLDTKSIELSQEWLPTLLAGLDAADWLLVLISQKAVQSPWVARETKSALERLPGRIIPIVLDDARSKDLDDRLEKYQHSHYGKEPHQCVNRLIKVLSDARFAGYACDIVGSWMSAVQPVYYGGEGWHVQPVEITASSDLYTVRTLPRERTLQWRLDAKLVSNAFLAGTWHSTRPGSRSQGYMTLQLARNGMYMCGHDYALAFGDSSAHIGVLLMARTEDNLQLAWKAMHEVQRALAPLDCRLDF